MTTTTNYFDYPEFFSSGDYTDLLNYSLSEDGKEFPVCTLSNTLDPSQLPIDTLDSEVSNEPTVVSMSTSFNSSSNFGDGPPDTTLVSRDDVHFYVRRARLLSDSDSHFGGLLLSSPAEPGQTSFSMAEDANTINIVLHVIYDIPFRHFTPSLDVLLETTKALKKYGIPLESKIAPGTNLYEEFVGKIPVAPIEVYAGAAENNLFHLASEASSYLLSFPLSTLSDDMAIRIGPIYLLMLFHLQTERLHVLHSLVVQPPKEHKPTLICGWTDYQCLKTAWSLACASFVFNASPDLSAGKIRNILESLGLPLSCEECKRSIAQRVQEIVLKWSITPRTIRRNTEEFRMALG